MNDTEFCNALYYILPTITRLLHAAEQERGEQYNAQRVDTLAELLNKVVHKFSQTKEGSGLRNTETVCALLILAGYIADTQVIDHEAMRTNGEKLENKFINDLFAEMSTTGKPN